MAKKKKEESKSQKRYATHITAANGKRVYISASSQEELDRKVNKSKLAMGAGLDITEDMSFEEYAWIWFDAYKSAPKLRPSSQSIAKWTLEHKVLPAFKGMKLREVKPLHIQAFLNSISGLSRSAQSKAVQQVRGIFRSAEENCLISRSPVHSTDKAGGEVSKEKDALTREQAALVLEATRGTPCYLFCLLALTTGMRRGEILGLMWEDVDLDSGYINVTHNKPVSATIPNPPVTTLLKTDAANRRLPIPPLLHLALVEERTRGTSKFVLCQENGESHTISSFTSMWRRVEMSTVRKARPLGYKGVDTKGVPFTVLLDFHCHPHLLRHTYATQLFEEGLDLKQVQYLLGHSTPEMTLRVYTHYRQKSREQETADQVKSATKYLSAGIAPDSGAKDTKILQFPVRFA